MFEWFKLVWSKLAKFLSGPETKELSPPVIKIDYASLGFEGGPAPKNNEIKSHEYSYSKKRFYFTFIDGVEERISLSSLESVIKKYVPDGEKFLPVWEYNIVVMPHKVMILNPHSRDRIDIDSAVIKMECQIWRSEQSKKILNHPDTYQRTVIKRNSESLVCDICNWQAAFKQKHLYDPVVLRWRVSENQIGKMLMGLTVVEDPMLDRNIVVAELAKPPEHLKPYYKWLWK